MIGIDTSRKVDVCSPTVGGYLGCPHVSTTVAITPNLTPDHICITEGYNRGCFPDPKTTACRLDGIEIVAIFDYTRVCAIS